MLTACFQRGGALPLAEPAVHAAGAAHLAAAHQRRAALQPHAARQRTFPAIQAGLVVEAQHDLVLVAARRRLQHAGTQEAGKARRQDLALPHPGQEIAVALGLDVTGDEQSDGADKAERGMRDS